MQNNLVAKHCRTYNKATVQRDRTKFHRPSTRTYMDEWFEENEGWDDPGLANPKEFETPSISANAYTRSFINIGDNMDTKACAMKEAQRPSTQQLYEMLYGNVNKDLIKLEPKMHKHLNWVFDLETLGTKRNAIVTEISAIGFDILSGEVFCQYTKHLDIDEQVKLGREVSGGTIGFWLTQSEEARMKVCRSSKDFCQSAGLPMPCGLTSALMDLIKYIDNTSCKWATDYSDLEDASPRPLVWGNGINFDLGKVESLFESTQFLNIPWDFWAERDARTLMDLLPGCKYAFGADFRGTPHYGLDDCRHELRYLAAAYIHLWELSKEK